MLTVWVAEHHRVRLSLGVVLYHEIVTDISKPEWSSTHKTARYQHA